MRYGSVILTLLFAPLLLADAQWITLDPEMQDSVADVTVLADNEDSTVIEFSLPGFYWDTMTVCSTLAKKTSFRSQIGVPGLGYGNTDTPILPYQSVAIIIPPRSLVGKSYKANEDTTISNFLVIPQIISSNKGESGGFYNSIYASNDSFPAKPVEWGGINCREGVRSLYFWIKPMRYNAGDTSLTIFKTIEVKFKYSGEDTSSLFPNGPYKLIPSQRRHVQRTYLNWEKWSS